MKCHCQVTVHGSGMRFHSHWKPTVRCMWQCFFNPWETPDSCRFLVQIKLLSVACFSWRHDIFRPFCLCTRGSTCRIRSLGLLIYLQIANKSMVSFIPSLLLSSNDLSKSGNKQSVLTTENYLFWGPTIYDVVLFLRLLGCRQFLLCSGLFVLRRSWLLAAKPAWPDGCLPF